MNSKMARFPGGWNYRGYCVYRSDVTPRWRMVGDDGEWVISFRTLAEFRRTCDHWERQAAKRKTT